MSSHADSFVASGNSPAALEERLATTVEPFSVVQGSDSEGQTVNGQPRKRRGRPARNGIPRTDAERKAASRQNQKQKLQDAERHRTITALKRMYWPHLPESELRGISTEQLRLYLEDKPVDTRGRLPGEHQTPESGLEYFAALLGRCGRRVRPRGVGPDS